MARYSKEHKARSRAALLSTGARLFRRNGYDGIGLNDLCEAAGLTHGAFYAHFPSKRAFYAAVLDEGEHDLVRRLDARPGRSRRALARQGVQVARDYLDARHRESVVGGCSLAALAIDTVRADAPAQAAYADVVAEVAREFGRGLPETRGDEDRTLAAIALCVGGLLVSAACGEAPIGRRLGDAARRQVSILLGEATS